MKINKMKMKTFNVQAYGIKITLFKEDKGTTGVITSDMHEPVDNESYEAAINAIEGLVLAHACAGMNVNSPEYLEGLETVVDKIMNEYGE